MTENEMIDPKPPEESVQVKTTSWPKYLLPFLVILSAVSLLNLIVSFAVLNSLSSPDLPATLDTEIARENLADFFRKAYNEREDAKIYNWFDPLIRLKIDQQQFARQMAELRALFPTLEDLVFASYECAEQPGGAINCRLYYDGKTGDGKKVLFTLFVQSQSSDKHRIQGFTLTSQQ